MLADFAVGRDGQRGDGEQVGSCEEGHDGREDDAVARDEAAGDELKGNDEDEEDNEDEKKLIVTMKKASRLIIIGNTDKGDQTTDHYSMMGFTKAYKSAKKNCS